MFVAIQTRKKGENSYSSLTNHIISSTEEPEKITFRSNSKSDDEQVKKLPVYS